MSKHSADVVVKIALDCRGRSGIAEMFAKTVADLYFGQKQLLL